MRLIVSGGNFHAEPVGFAADMIALALAEIGAIAQRRVALMVDPMLSFDLPPFLTPAPRPELRPDDRRGHHGGLDERKQAPRHALRDRFNAHIGQSGRSRQHGRPWRASLGQMVENLNVILGVEAHLRRPGHRFPRAADNQPPRCKRSWPACAARSPPWATTAIWPPIWPPPPVLSPPARWPPPLACPTSCPVTGADHA